MAEVDKVGTGLGGLVVPGDLDDSLVDEAVALGNGEDSVVDEAVVSSDGGEVQDAAPASRGNGEDRDWRDIDRHADRVISVLGGLWKDSEQKAERTLGKLLQQTEENFEGKLRDIKLHVTGSVGVAGREQAAAAWRGPAEALRLLSGCRTRRV